MVRARFAEQAEQPRITLREPRRHANLGAVVVAASRLQPQEARGAAPAHPYLRIAPVYKRALRRPPTGAPHLHLAHAEALGAEHAALKRRAR
eukprot:1068037-Pleurochrysis_carterae.AAC.1